MKHIRLSGLLTLTLLLSVAACQEKEKSKSSSSSNLGSTSGGFTTGGTSGGTSGTSVGGFTTGSVTGSTTGGTSASTTGGSTTGTVTGGASSAYAVTIAMSGRGGACDLVNPSTPCDSWFMGMVPSNMSGVQVGEFIPLNSSNIAFFAADAYFKVRVTVLSQPPISNTTTGAYCWGRLFPQAQSPSYTKLRYTVAIRDITLRSGVYHISPRYAQIGSSTNIFVNGREIYDFSNRLNSTRDGFDVVGYAVEVLDVMSDSNCMGSNGSTACGSLGVDSVKDGSCWSVRAELATDVNRPF